MLDHEGKDMANVLSSIVGELVNIGYIDENTGEELLRVLLFRHKYVDSKLSKKWTMNHRNQSIVSLTDHEEQEKNKWSKFSRQFSRQHDHSEFSHQIKHLLDEDQTKKNVPEIVCSEDNTEVIFEGQNNGHGGYLSVDMSHEFSSIPSFGGDLHKLSEYAKKHSIMMRVPEDTEGALTLVGALEFIEEPLTAFVRLEEGKVLLIFISINFQKYFSGIIMPNALEIPLPMRFIFLLLTPQNSSYIDGHEVGRSFSALMSNRRFHHVCYR